MSSFFIMLYHVFLKRRWLLAVSVIVAVGGMGFAAYRLHFQEDISQFIPQDKQVKKYSNVLKNIRLNDKLVVAIHLTDSSLLPDPDKLIAYGEEFVSRLKQRFDSTMVRSVTFRLSEMEANGLYDVFYRNLPQFLDSADYARIDSMLSYDAIERALKKNYHTLITPAGVVMKDLIARDPLGITSLAIQKLSSLQSGARVKITNDCMFSPDRKNLLIFINTARSSDQTSANASLIEGIDEIIEGIDAENGGSMHADYFGAVAVAAGNAKQMKNDTMLTMGIALGLLLLLLSFFYRKKRVILFLLLPVALGALFALAMMQLIRGELSTIAIGAGSIILGIAINYSIHFFTHLKHTFSAETTIRDLASPMTIGSITTIGAFLSLLFVESRALKDFGLFAALVLIGSVLATLIILPHVSGKQKTADTTGPAHRTLIERFSAIRFENSRIWLWVIVALTVFFSFFAPRVSFDSDMSNLSYVSEEMKAAERRLSSITDSNLSAVYVVSQGKDLNEALIRNELIAEKSKALQKEGVLFSATGPGALLLSEPAQQAKLKMWQEFWASRSDSVIQRILRAGDNCGFTGDAFESFTHKITESGKLCSLADMELLRSNFASDYIMEDSGSSMVISMLKTHPEQRDKLIAALPDNEHTTIVDRRHMASAFAEVINKDFNLILLFTSLLVFIFLVMSYGRLELGLLAFIPMLISWIWILGIMALLGIKFNIFSIILSAFIFGLGDDYSIFILDGLLQKFRSGKENLNSYKTAVFLSALTTLIGVGVLIFAKHPALKSIAITTIIGMVSVVLVSYTVSPAIFRWMTAIKNKPRTFPVTLGGILYAMVFYSYFIGGCIATVLCGWTMIPLLPIGKKRRKLAYHYMLYMVCKTTIYIMFMVKKRFINFDKETFKKPCLVICNHQSLIDIPLALMWTPKMIMITNERVYYSPLIGKLVQLGGFFPASSGYEDISIRLKELIADGYSIFVFPEGTRAEDRNVKRFHKGAFYLAEQLGLEILPMVMHGTGEYIKKGEYFGRRSAITVKFLDRISPADKSWGETYSERTKSIQKAFHKEFYSIKEQYYSSVDYHRDLLFRNFIYKGPILEWYMRIKVRIEDNYRFFDELLPKKGVITDVGCGYGFLSYMMAMTSSGRKVYGIDYDEDKIDVASHGISKPANAHFLSGDVLDVAFEKSDAFVIADVLHYMPEDWQKKVIKKCTENLNPGGMIVIRDADTSLQKKHKGTAITEFFSTKVLSFNKTRQGKELYFTSRETVYDSLKNTTFAVDIIDETKFTSNIFYVIRDRG
jgi:1-acyl-sn-glycerol-3-phosphate acyltransferase